MAPCTAVGSSEGQCNLTAVGSSEGRRNLTAVGSSEGRRNLTAVGSSEGQCNLTAVGSSEGQHNLTAVGSSEGRRNLTAVGSGEGQRNLTPVGSSGGSVICLGRKFCKKPFMAYGYTSVNFCVTGTLHQINVNIRKTIFKKYVITYSQSDTKFLDTGVKQSQLSFDFRASGLWQTQQYHKLPSILWQPPQYN